MLPRLPPAFPAALPLLEHLDLTRTLLPPTALDLRGAERLTHLGLTGFAADRAVDLAVLPRLRVLLLHECHLYEPPPGLAEATAITQLVGPRSLLPLSAAKP